MSYDRIEGLKFFAVMLAVLVVCVLGVLGLVSIGNRASFPMELARIEQLRMDAANVDPSQAEDVIGQVTEANRTIARIQACNHAWYCDFMHTDKWNGVRFIPVPKVVK